MSAVRTVLAAAALSMTFAGIAFARDAVFTIRLEQPAAAGTRVIAQNTVWSCNGDTCLARPSHGVSVRSCRQFVRESGVRVTSYGAPGNELTAAEIARCNGDAATQQAAN